MARARKQSHGIADAEPPQRRSRAATVGTDATTLARAAFQRAGFEDPTLVLRWREIAGPEVARIARPLRLSEGPSGTVLTLKADPAASLFLQHETRTLCARINGFLGGQTVQRLRFVAGEIVAEPERRQQKHPQDSPAGDPACQFAGDDNLKTALSALARARRRT